MRPALLTGWKRPLLALAALALLLGGVGWGVHFAALRLRDQGLRLIESRHEAEALAPLRRSVALWPWQPNTYLLLAWASLHEGRIDEATRAVESAERHGADPAEVTLATYLLDLRRGKLKPGVEPMLWHRVEQGHPRSTWILESLAKAYLHGYRLGEAQRCVQRWLELAPEDPEAYFVRGLIHEGLHAMDLAGEDYEAALERSPDQPRYRQHRAEWCLFRNQTVEAAEHFQALVFSHADRPEYRFGLARCLIQLGRLKEADVLLRDLENVPSLGLGVFLERGKWANLSGRPEEAERAYRRAVEIDPSSSDAYRGLAASLKRAGKSEESETCRRRADELERDVERLYQIRSFLGKQPDDMKARFEAAQICLRNGQKAEARRWLQSILRLRPDHQPSLGALKQCD